MKDILSQRIKALRAQKGISRKELAAAIGIGYSLVAAWENAISFPRIYNLIALAKFFGVKINFLLGLID